MEYSTPPLSMKQIIDRYVKAKGIHVPENDNRGPASYNDQMYNEITQLKNETLNLQLSLRRYTGDDLSNAQFEELSVHEHQLEQAVQKVRAQQLQLLHEQVENLKRTEAMLEKENQEMYHWLMSNQIQRQAEMEEQQQAMTELKMVEEQPLLNQMPFFGEDLQLGSYNSTLPLFSHTYRLQPTHPNLQDSDLHSGRIGGKISDCC
ncbi:hypothetical protein ACS0TY_028398 [Phlomoides rotata]